MALTYNPSEPKHSSPLRKVAAFRDLPSLVIPERIPNQPSYPLLRPPPGERKPDETLLPPTFPPSPQDINGKHATRSITSWLSDLPDIHAHDMFQFPEKLGSVPSTPAGSPPCWAPRSRMSYWSLTPRKMVLIIATCLAIWAMNSFWSLTNRHGVGVRP